MWPSYLPYFSLSFPDHFPSNFLQNTTALLRNIPSDLPKIVVINIYKTHDRF